MTQFFLEIIFKRDCYCMVLFMLYLFRFFYALFIYLFYAAVKQKNKYSLFHAKTRRDEMSLKNVCVHVLYIISIYLFFFLISYLFFLNKFSIKVDKNYAKGDARNKSRQ